MNIAYVRDLIVAVRALAPAMNEDEISDIAIVIVRVTERLLKESEGKNE